MACDICYTRKVRCELEQGRPCIACRKNGSSCTFNTEEASKLRRRTRKQRRSASKGLGRFPKTCHHGMVDRTCEECSPSARPEQDTADTGDKCLVSSNEDPVDDYLLPNKVLALFFRHGFDRTSWSTFERHGNTRMAYTGSPAANLAALSNVQEPISRAPSGSSLHVPFPSIRSHLPWKPDERQPLLNWYSSSMKTDIASLPSKDVLDDLVNAYFAKINPLFPVIDESDFRRQYDSTSDQPPLLLLQAVLLAGAHVSSHPKVMRSRSMVERVIYRRVKALFDMRHENDRMHLIQTALLLAWHSDGGADDVSSNVYYWAGVAARIAFGLGIHRDLSPTSATAMPAKDRRIYRRLWWTLYQVEILASLQHGRPSMMDPTEIDQPEPLQDDFIEQDGKLNERIDVEFCTHQVSLCRIIYSGTKFFSPGMMRRYSADAESYKSAKENLDNDLALWYLDLPRRLTSHDSSELNGATQLQIHFNIALLHLHRPPEPNIYETVESPPPADPTCADAAVSIAKAFEAAILLNRQSQCWFSSVGAVLAAGIQFAYEAQSAMLKPDSIRALQALNRLESLLVPVRELSNYWPVADAVHELLNELLKQYKPRVEKLLRNSMPSPNAHASADQPHFPEPICPHFDDIPTRAATSSIPAAEWPYSCEPKFHDDGFSADDVAIAEWLSESLYQSPDFDIFAKH